MSDLSDLLLSRLPEGWTWRQAAREAEKRGIQLSTATVTAYLGDRHGRPSEQILAAFSELLDIPMSDLRRAAGVAPGENEPYQPPAEASRLTQRQRAALDELIRSFVTAQGVDLVMTDASGATHSVELKTTSVEDMFQHLRELSRLPGVTAADWSATVERFIHEFGPIDVVANEARPTVSDAPSSRRGAISS